MAVEQADEFIRTGEASQPEKQSVDCVLINADNAEQYTLFALEG
jgi:erythritol transport system substrate-binding protein